MAGITQTLGVDYNLDMTLSVVTFVSAPADEAEVEIKRRDLISLDPTGGPSYNLAQWFFQVALDSSDIYSFQMLLNGVLLRPRIDYTFDPVTKMLRIVRDPKATGERVLIWCDIQRPE